VFRVNGTRRCARRSASEAEPGGRQGRSSETRPAPRPSSAPGRPGWPGPDPRRRRFPVVVATRQALPPRRRTGSLERPPGPIGILWPVGSSQEDAWRQCESSKRARRAAVRHRRLAGSRSASASSPAPQQPGGPILPLPAFCPRPGHLAEGEPATRRSPGWSVLHEPRLCGRSPRRTTACRQSSGAAVRPDLSGVGSLPSAQQVRSVSCRAGGSDEGYHLVSTQGQRHVAQRVYLLRARR